MKIGILTHYHNSMNYGGMLQAYALTRFLNQGGYDAEQIVYQMSTEPYEKNSPNVSADAASSQVESFLPIKFMKRIYNSLNYRFIEKNREKYYWDYRNHMIPKRREKFRQFEDFVSHSQKVYDFKNIEDSKNIYDCFITGSDQIWNFTWFNPAFFVDFSGKNRRIAYAASAGKSAFTEKEQAYMRRTLKNYDAISVRESDLPAILNCMLEQESVIQTVDPTLLLDQDDWNKITADRLIRDDYIFCYFLHNDKNLRQLALRYARKKKLSIATIPFSDIEYNRYDIHFGIYHIDDAGPADFLSLIKHAKYVLTDSFHATVFSLMFHKQFVVFPRGNGKGMGSRLYSLLDLFECKERFCDVDEEKRFEYALSLDEYNYRNNYPRYETMKRQSEEFLMKNLKKEEVD